MALIECDSVSKCFVRGDETIVALSNVSFQIKAGEFVSIIGASGSGKTTLMNILGLLDIPSSGHYQLAGNSSETLNDDKLAHLRNSEIGFVFQSFNLLSRVTSLRNVEMPLVYAASHMKGLSMKVIRERAVETLKRVGLADRMEHIPNELSGGQRQRVAIARALVNRPKILLADEPTGALDSRTGLEILKLFEELNREGSTVILVTHDKAVATRARRSISLADGKIISDERF